MLDLPKVFGLRCVSPYLRLVAFPHTVFALPFALIALIVAAQGLPPLRVLLLVLVCMVTARNSAMAFNRLADRHYDKANPRTANRTLPSGELTPRAVGFFVAINAAIFLAAAYGINKLAFALSPVALAFIFFYSFTKRFTWLSHWVLGICLAIAPVAAWITVTGTIGFPSLLLSTAVVFWVAGFDILYSLQDIAFDRTEGLFSLPARWGTNTALWISRACHLGCFLLWLAIRICAGLSGLYFYGLAAIALLMSCQHFLVRGGDSSKMGTAFFTVNGWVSVGMFLLVAVDVLTQK